MTAYRDKSPSRQENSGDRLPYTPPALEDVGSVQDLSRGANFGADDAEGEGASVT